ncbi:MAG: DNA modification methyltransferase [Pirellulaceae bacterium]|nr:MAG: DNA modification methyltransferase [Pirellulaceae bacterium]
MRYPFRTRLDWREWVMPHLLRERPIHRWFVFPHSFTDDIVRALVEEWGLGKSDQILDPFVGAGTTVLAAMQLGISAIGFDLSPLAVLATQVKTAKYDADALTSDWEKLRRRIKVCKGNGEAKTYARLVQEALPGSKLATFHWAKATIEDLDAPSIRKAFFKLALLAQIRKFSNAVPTGGWLSWRANRRPAAALPHELEHSVKSMLDDLWITPRPSKGTWRSRIADARGLPVEDASCAAVITSPPYPNRHDYTRVFGVELMFGFLDWEETRDLRYQLLHSHPEAKPNRPAANGYVEPALITKAVRDVAKHEERGRIVDMLQGYFLDLYLSMKEVSRVLKPGGKAAFVVGNAQYYGIPIEVDKATALIGKQTGLKCIEIRVVRQRGNSAQQMKIHGRHPSRESVVIFSKPE